MGYSFEYGGEKKAGNSYNEDRNACTSGCGIFNIVFLSFASDAGVLADYAMKHTVGYECGYYDRHKAWEYQIGYEGFGIDIAGHPQHDGGDIPDWRPCTPAIGGNDDDSRKYPSFFLYDYKFAYKHNHDDSGCHVI